MASKRTFSYFFLLLFVPALLGTQGCVAAAAVGAAGVGYGAYKYGSSKSGKEAESKNIQTYDAYKADAEKLNLEREKAGLKTQPVMTYAEWKLARNITTPAPEPAMTASTAKLAENK